MSPIVDDPPLNNTHLYMFLLQDIPKGAVYLKEPFQLLIDASYSMLHKNSNHLLLYFFLPYHVSPTILLEIFPYYTLLPFRLSRDRRKKYQRGSLVARAS